LFVGQWHCAGIVLVTFENIPFFWSKEGKEGKEGKKGKEGKEGKEERRERRERRKGGEKEG
jgi:hypothetical protein